MNVPHENMIDLTLSQSFCYKNLSTVSYQLFHIKDLFWTKFITNICIRYLRKIDYCWYFSQISGKTTLLSDKFNKSKNPLPITKNTCRYSLFTSFSLWQVFNYFSEFLHSCFFKSIKSLREINLFEYTSVIVIFHQWICKINKIFIKILSNITFICHYIISKLDFFFWLSTISGSIDLLFIITCK